jgi:NAD(P)H-flavin reductase
MASVKHEGKTYEINQGETVLGALLRGGVKVSYACRAGACQSCLMRAERGAVPASAQAGLKDTMKARGYFLACCCRPEEDLDVTTAGADVQVPATITSIDRLTESVARVRLKPSGPWEYRPGQYAVLLRDDGLARSYSLASLPTEDAVEMHVRKMPSGRMSGWLYDTAKPGDAVRLQGPSGECFYMPGRPEQPLLLAGTGTGLAPLYGVVRDALAQGHTGPIWLYHGARSSRDLYLTSELSALAERHPNVQYCPTVLEGEAAGRVTVGPLDKTVLGVHPKLAGVRVFVCGNPDLVPQLKKKFYLAGASLREIHADPFLPSAA